MKHYLIIGCLQGSGGGPSEDNVSGSILKSAGQPWKQNSLLAVDAGIHLSGIIDILDSYKKSDAQSAQDGDVSLCPFSETALPFKTGRANAAYILRELLSTFLITHAHLDHISGLAIATAALKNVKMKKRIAALPHTITAIRKHIFNDFIWPNLSDEDGGVGLVTYMRLPQAAQDYIWVAEGLSVQAWAVSHGHCLRKHSHRGSTAGLRLSVSSIQSPPSSAPCESAGEPCVVDSTTYFIRDELTQCEVLMFGDVEPDSISLSPRNFEVWCLAAKKMYEGKLRAVFIECSFDNCQPDAYLFGHLSPRHLYDELMTLAKQVVLLREAAAQDALLQRDAGIAAMAMEMEWRSYNNKKRKRKSVGWGEGQRIPGRRWENGPGGTIEETDGEFLSGGGTEATRETEPVIRRNSAGGVSPKCTATDPKDEPPELMLSPPATVDNVSHIPTTQSGDETAATVTHTANGHENGIKKVTAEPDLSVRPLEGLLIVVNHVKDTLEDDVDAVDAVYNSLQTLEKEKNLGCKIVMARKGLSIFF